MAFPPDHSRSGNKYDIVMNRFCCFALLVLFCACTSPSKESRLPPPATDNGGLVLPEGFDALVVTDSIGRARHLTVNENGDIYVKLTFNDAMNGGGGTVGIRDVNGDGRADSIVYFGDYKDEGGSAVGVTIHNGYLYTSTVRHVLRTKLDGNLVPLAKSEIVFTDDTDVVKNWHTTKPLAFDDKGFLYIPFGGPSDAGQDLSKYGPVGIPGGKGLDPSPELQWHGGVWRFPADKINLTKKDGFKFSTGIRSVVGMTWNPVDKSVYAVVNGMDNFHTLFPDKYSAYQGAVLPSETLIRVSEGSDFGWPYAYYDHIQKKNVLQPAYGGDGKIQGRASAYTEPVIGFPGHWAPMDLLFYKGSQFPPRYRDGVFIAFHGSTDRSPYPQAGYIVCFVPLKNGKSDGTWEVFADGFAGVDTVVNTNDARYRPMGLAEGPDGSLYISESNKGKIWRVMFRGKKEDFSTQSLAKMERLKSKTYIKDPDEHNDKLATSTQEGWKLYNIYCTSCHQGNGKGDNNRFPPLAGSEYVTGDKTRLIKILLNGLNGEITVDGKKYNGLMPAFGHLDDYKVASILSYIRTHFKNNSTPVSSVEVMKVRTAR
jgi:glucose/arabinose dehydrogenase